MVGKLNVWNAVWNFLEVAAMPLTQKQIADAIAASADSPKSIKLADGRSLYLVARRGRGFWVYQFRGRNKTDTEDDPQQGPRPGHQNDATRCAPPTGLRS